MNKVFFVIVVIGGVGVMKKVALMKLKSKFVVNVLNMENKDVGKNF
jgi:hypothetical protein